MLNYYANNRFIFQHNMSCLGWAAGRGHLGVVKALLEKEARVNTTDKVGGLNKVIVHVILLTNL